jgi:hypothetical protein
MKTTIDQIKIMQWVTEHNGSPAVIDAPEAKGDKVGLRINFPGFLDERELADFQETKTVSWEEFFKIFEEQKLLFMYDDKTKDSNPVNWYKLGKRE